MSTLASLCGESGLAEVGSYTAGSYTFSNSGCRSIFVLDHLSQDSSCNLDKGGRDVQPFAAVKETRSTSFGLLPRREYAVQLLQFLNDFAFGLFVHWHGCADLHLCQPLVP